MVIRADRAVELLEPTATVVGLFKSWSGLLAKTTLGARDVAVLCSDGVTEAGIESGPEYGEERLISSIQAAANESPTRIVDRLIASLQAYNPGRQHDDITLIVLRGT